MSREVWDAVQRRLDEIKNQRDNGIYRKHGSHFFFGRILCGECGEPMIEESIEKETTKPQPGFAKIEEKGKKATAVRNLFFLKKKFWRL